MKRREFLRLSGGLFLASQLPVFLHAKEDENLNSVMMKEIRKITIPVGATKPFSALHLSDSHFTRVDDRDNERKKNLAEGRSKIFPKAEAYFDAAVNYARKKDLMLIHTGDLIDFVSVANLEYVAEKLGGDRWFTAAGNHEYSQYVGEACEDAAYRAQSYDKVQASFPNDLTFASCVVNGVNFVAVDDGYYHFTKHQQKLMKKEIKKGLPIVMLCHVPLYTPEHCKAQLASNGGKCAYMTGAPLEVTETFQCDPSLPKEEQWRNRSVQQRADKPTLEFIAWLKKQPLLKAILCGHMHTFYQEQFSPTAIQYTVAAGYNGAAYEIEFV